MAIKIPANPQALTADWLTDALRRHDSTRDVTVTRFAVMPLDENKGFYGQLVRLSLDYANSKTAAPQTLIAKFSSTTPEMRKRSVDSYEREVRFYQQLASATDLPTPLCYYAAINLETGEHILLLQDLSPMQSGSRVAGCTPDQARLAIAHIAKLHLHWWGRTGEATLDWLADGDVDLNADLMRQHYEQWWPRFYEQAKHNLPDELTDLSMRLGDERARIRRRVFGSSPRTLIHRDYQLENLFFGKGKEFAIVDWQFLSRGRGVWDVAYFLSESLLPADRRQVEMELLASYHRTLVDHGIHDYPFKQCLDDFRFCLLQRHTALVSTIAAMPFSEEQRHIHINILLPRNIAAILDHNAFDLLL